MHYPIADKSDYAVKSQQQATVAANTASSSNDTNITAKNQKNAQGNKTNKRTKKRKNNNFRGTNQLKSARLSPPTNQRTAHNNDDNYLNNDQEHQNQPSSSDLLFKSPATDMQASNIIKAPQINATTTSQDTDQQCLSIIVDETKDTSTDSVFNHLIEAVTSSSDQFAIDEMSGNKIKPNEISMRHSISLDVDTKDDHTEPRRHSESVTNRDGELPENLQTYQKEARKSISQVLSVPEDDSWLIRGSTHHIETDNVIDCKSFLKTVQDVTDNVSGACVNETTEETDSDFNRLPVLEETLCTKERLNSSTTPEPTLIDKEWLSANIATNTQPETINLAEDPTEPVKDYGNHQLHASSGYGSGSGSGSGTKEMSSDVTSPSSDKSDLITVDSRPLEEIQANLNPKHPEFPQTVISLKTLEGCPVYLIGTSHFSKKSIQDVVTVMQMVRPTAVVLELCREREMMLRLDEDKLLTECGNEFSLINFRTASKRAGAVQGTIFILFLRLSAILTKKLGMAPGGEFRAAARQAKEIPGCRLYFGDRSLKVTISRAVNSLSFWQKLKFVYSAITADMSNMTQDELESFKDKDVLEKMLKEIGDDFPAFKQVLLDERNTYLAHNIYSTATTQSPDKSTVAVVGIGHLQGIVNNWGTTTESEIEYLETIPIKSRTSILIRKGIKYTLWGAVAYSGYRLICPTQIQNLVSGGLGNIFSQVTKLRHSSVQ